MISKRFLPLPARRPKPLAKAGWVGPGASFKSKVLSVVIQIPRGKTLTYKQVAELAGSPRAYRAVGSILKKKYDPDIPCHRVIKSNGEIGEYNRGRDLKIKKLQTESRK